MYKINYIHDEELKNMRKIQICSNREECLIMVGEIGLSASNYINILAQPQSSDNYAYLNNSSLYIADDNAIYVGISKMLLTD